MTRAPHTLRPCFDAPALVARHPAVWCVADVLEVLSLIAAAALAGGAILSLL
jgi:hypothetical protein